MKSNRLTNRISRLLISITGCFGLFLLGTLVSADQNELLGETTRIVFPQHRAPEIAASRSGQRPSESRATLAETPDPVTVLLVNGTNTAITEVRLDDASGKVISQGIPAMTVVEASPSQIDVRDSPYDDRSTFNNSGIFVRFDNNSVKVGSAIMDGRQTDGKVIIWIFHNGVFTSTSTGHMIGVTF